MIQKIFHLISGSKNILLVGPSDSGKTFFIKNELIPFFKKQGKNITYFKNINKKIILQKEEIVVLDEFEILDDQTFLEKLHPEEKPYYSEKYLNCVHKWIKKAKNIKNSCIYILTRNEKQAIENVKKIKTFSFKENVKIIEFKYRKRCKQQCKK